jgi:hypothetical protein
MTPSLDDRNLMRELRRLATRQGTGSPIPRKRDADIAMTDELTRRGLIARTANGADVLTDLGRTFLKRKLAGDDGFATQHQSRATIDIDDEELGRHRVLVNEDESPLGWLRRHKGRDGRPLIDAAEFAAGERLRADYTRGQIMPRVTANWTATVARGRRDGGRGGMAELTEAAIAARRRVEDALDAVGPDFAGILVDFCCFLKGIEEIERSRQFPARSAKLIIRLALASLARHYGLSTTARGKDSSRKLLHWGAEDYRPRI